jgi:hypothetical protein
MARLVSIPDYSRESFPYIFYRKIGLVNEVNNITFPLDYGFNFMLERFNARWSSINAGIPATYAGPLKIELFKNAGGQALQKLPVDLTLICSPAESGISIDLVNPAAPFTAKELDRSKAINVLYFFADVVHLVVSGVSAITIPGDPAGSLPAYVEFMLKGRYFPALNQEGWQK